MHSFLYNIWGLVTSQILYPYAEYKIGRQILPKLRTLRQEAKLPFSKRKTLAQQRLASTLEAAGADVPYYRDLFRTARFDPVKVRNDVRYLNELPYLTKEILREQEPGWSMRNTPTWSFGSRKPVVPQGLRPLSAMIRNRWTGQPLRIS